MFILFTFSFGDDFYIAAGVLLSIELIGQFLKIIDFSSLYEKFKEKELVDDFKLAMEVKKATNMY